MGEVNPWHVGNTMLECGKYFAHVYLDDSCCELDVYSLEGSDGHVVKVVAFLEEDGTVDNYLTNAIGRNDLSNQALCDILDEIYCRPESLGDIVLDTREGIKLRFETDGTSQTLWNAFRSYIRIFERKAVSEKGAGMGQLQVKSRERVGCSFMGKGIKGNPIMGVITDAVKVVYDEYDVGFQQWKGREIVRVLYLTDNGYVIDDVSLADGEYEIEDYAPNWRCKKDPVWEMAANKRHHIPWEE